MADIVSRFAQEFDTAQVFATLSDNLSSRGQGITGVESESWRRLVKSEKRAAA